MSIGTPLKRRVASTVPESARPVVDLAPGEPKSGCSWCTLLPWSPDFEAHRGRYQLDPDKVRAREPDGHTVVNRCVGDDWDPVDILFITDTPGTDDDRKGTAFFGRSGGMLRKCVDEIIPKDLRCGYTALVRCRPPRGKDPTKGEVRCCSGHLIREIHARKPRLIVCTGNKALEFFTGQSGIRNLAGRFLDIVRPGLPEDLKVLGCLHPSFVARFDHELDGFVDTIETAGKYIKGEADTGTDAGEYIVIDDLENLRILSEGLMEADRFAFDTETGALTPFQKKWPALLCVSFSDAPGVGYTVPLDHAESPWCVGGPRANEREEVIGLLRDVLHCPVLKFAQNEKFDRNHLRHAIGAEPVNVRDTMLHHLVLDETRGTHGLKVLAFAYTGMGGYDYPLDKYKKEHAEADPDKGGSYANIPGHLLFPYAAMDADVTLRVADGLEAEPEYKGNPQYRALVEHFFPALSETLADMEYAGAQVDPEVVRLLEEDYTQKMLDTRAQIDEIPEIRRFVRDRQEELDAKRKPGSRARRQIAEFNPNSPKQLQTILFDYFKETPMELTDTGFDRMLLRWNRAKEKGDRKAFQEVVSEAIEKQEWQHFTTKADVMHEYEARGNPLASMLLEYRGFSTLNGTFVAPLRDLLDEKLRVHGTFIIPGTVTGRLASENPNLQNIPNKGGGLIKRAYVSRFGDEGVLLQIDYSQIELRVAASFFSEPSMIAAYVNGEDLHTLTAAGLAGCKDLAEFKLLPKGEQKEWRTRAKRVNFGILYGGGPPALMSTLKKDGVNLTLKEAAELIEKYFKIRPALKRGIDNLQNVVRKTGYLESFTGRRRRVPEVFSEDEEIIARALRQSVNFPIQSGAADMTLMAMILIRREMIKRGLRSQMVLTVHDSIVFDCHVDEFLEVAKLAKEIMETLPERSETVLPGLDWSWLRCPIVAECELGSTWGTLVEFDPFVVEAEPVTDTPLVDIVDGKKVARNPVSIDELWELMAMKDAA